MARGKWASSGRHVAPMLGTPAGGTAFAVRASQAGNGNLIDQGPAANALTNSGLIAVAWLGNAPVALGAYRTPTALDGRLYKCTTAGTNGASEPAWNTTIGGTTTSGTAVYTTEKGPYFVDTSGVRLFRSLASSQIGGPGTFILSGNSPNASWDMALGQSLIINMRLKFDYNASGQAAASPILSNRNLTGPNRGIRILATGSTVQGIRVQIRDSNGVSILSGDTASAFGLKALDGSERNVTVMIDGALKMGYCYIDGVGLTQANMFDGNTLCPNGMNLASLTGSTAGSNWTVGGDSGAATSFECAFRAIDVTVVQGGLPANIQNIASWYTRGGEGTLPQALVS